MDSRAVWKSAWLRHLSGVVVLVALASLSACRPGGDDLFRWRIDTSVEIDAPPEAVWSVLVDLTAYPQWNPFIVEASGNVAEGEKLSLQMALPGHDPMLIEPRLLRVDEARELRWRGKLFVQGLFDGEHAFVLVALPDSRTRLEHWESFSGLLMPIAKPLIRDDTVQAFHALNQAMARRAEHLARSGGVADEGT